MKMSRSLWMPLPAARIPRQAFAFSTSSSHRFFVLRHGETDANAGGLIQGSSDFSRLTDVGKEQAAKVAKHAFARQKLDAIYVSPLTRARETLDIVQQTVSTEIFPEDDAIVMHNLREIDFYDWEGRDKYDLQAAAPDAWEAWKVGNPHQLVVNDQDGRQRRPLFELWERAHVVWSDIRLTKHSSSLLVAHGSLGQALLGASMGWDATHFRRHEFPNCGLLELEWGIAHEHASRWRWRWPEPSEWVQNERSAKVKRHE